MTAFEKFLLALVGLWLLSHLDPRLATIVKLARALEIPAAQLLDGIR